jgi:hypothetical protein
MYEELIFKIILESPPSGVDFGLQKGSGDKYETIQKQRSLNKDLIFEFPVTIKNNKNSAFDFYGSFIQGPSGERFVYIGIGTYAGEADSEWGRRLKIPLRDITFEMINQLAADPKLILLTKVAGTGKDGTPNCATVKPFDGWYLSPR